MANDKKQVTCLRGGTEVSPLGMRPTDTQIETLPIEISHSCELSPDKPLPYRTALFITGDGLAAEQSVTAAVQGGTCDEHTADGISIESHSDDFSAVIVDGGTYTVRNARLSMPTDSRGEHVCDFAGLGSVLAAFNGAKLTVENCDIATEGVAKCSVFADTGSDVLIRGSRLSVMGGKLYDGYVNSADFNYMVATPWVLGIMGNARGTNIMGNKTSMVLVDSDVKARNWGVLSTDNGEGNLLAVIDSTLTLTGGEDDRKNPYYKTWGSGYGTYILGADEDFRGVTIHAGTYVGIAREGNAIYRSSRGLIKILSARTGETLYEGEGRGEISRLHSDGFGLMAHDAAELTLTDGTVMTTENAAFLLRAGGVKIRVEDGAQLHVADGVLVQVLDDDDATVGVNWHGEKELEFHTEFHEKEGWPSENGQITSHMPPPDPSDMPPPPPDGEMPAPQFDVRFHAADVTLTGNLYNGSGYYGQKAKQLYVTLGSGAVLNGSVSATETIHVDEHGRQNTFFTSDQYYYLGHVANRPFFNGDNTVDVVLEDGAVWNVTGESILTSLTVQSGAVLNGRVAIDGAEIVPEAGKTYSGNIVVTATE